MAIKNLLEYLVIASVIIYHTNIPRMENQSSNEIDVIKFISSCKPGCMDTNMVAEWYNSSTRNKFWNIDRTAMAWQKMACMMSWPIWHGFSIKVFVLPWLQASVLKDQYSADTISNTSSCGEEQQKGRYLNKHQSSFCSHYIGQHDG